MFRFELKIFESQRTLRYSRAIVEETGFFPESLHYYKVCRKNPVSDRQARSRYIARSVKFVNTWFDRATI
jgi:hypothetical protein